MPNTAGQSGQTYFDSPIFNGPTPHEGPRALAVNCPFTSEIDEFNIDLTLSQTQAYISVIQGVFVDNSANADVVSITAVGATNQTINFPAGAQGYVPILATKPTSFNVASNGAVTVPIIFLNVSVPAIIWGESSGGGGGGGSTTIEIENPGSTPAIGSGATTSATSDPAGNVRVLGHMVRGTGTESEFSGAEIVPITCDYSDLGLSVHVNNSVFTQNNIYYDNYHIYIYEITAVEPTQVSGSGEFSVGFSLKNAGDNTVYIVSDPDNPPTPTNGFPVSPGETIDFGAPGGGNSFNGNLYAICNTGLSSTIAIRGIHT